MLFRSLKCSVIEKCANAVAIDDAIQCELQSSEQRVAIHLNLFTFYHYAECIEKNVFLKTGISTPCVVSIESIKFHFFIHLFSFPIFIFIFFLFRVVINRFGSVFSFFRSSFHSCSVFNSLIISIHMNLSISFCSLQFISFLFFFFPISISTLLQIVTM